MRIKSVFLLLLLIKATSATINVVKYDFASIPSNQITWSNSFMGIGSEIQCASLAMKRNAEIYSRNALTEECQIGNLKSDFCIVDITGMKVYIKHDTLNNKKCKTDTTRTTTLSTTSTFTALSSIQTTTTTATTIKHLGCLCKAV